MRLFLSDYIRIGATMETVKILEADMKGILLLGNLKYHEHIIHVKIKVNRDGVARIVSVVDNVREQAFNNLELLKKIRKDGVALNKNGLRNIVVCRTFSLLLWYFCMLSHVAMQLIVIRYALLNRVVVVPLVLMLLVILSMYNLKKNKWNLIPYGANRYGKK